jgi:hypothetical protein
LSGAAARDFADVYVLAGRFGQEVLLGRAAQVDAGLDTRILVGMLAILDRFIDDEIPLPGGSSVVGLRDFIWRIPAARGHRELQQSGPSRPKPLVSASSY